MTEDEAHQKQCCGPDGSGRWNEQPYPARWCVGSACMAWRTKTRTELRHKRDGSLLTQGTIYLRGEAEEVAVSDGGFCGLSGAQQ